MRGTCLIVLFGVLAVACGQSEGEGTRSRPGEPLRPSSTVVLREIGLRGASTSESNLETPVEDAFVNVPPASVLTCGDEQIDVQKVRRVVEDYVDENAASFPTRTVAADAALSVVACVYPPREQSNLPADTAELVLLIPGPASQKSGCRPPDTEHGPSKPAPPSAAPTCVPETFFPTVVHVPAALEEITP